MPPLQVLDPPVWDVQFGGSVEIANLPLTFDIYLQDGDPAVLVVDGIATIQLSAVFNHFFQPALTWPSDLFDLSLTDTVVLYAFIPGSQFSQLVLLPQEVLDRQSLLTGPGLFIATTVSLSVADVDVDFDATITVAQGAGFEVEAALAQPINLLDDPDFVQLSGSGFVAGPNLSVQAFPNGTKQIALSCAYTLFGEQFGESDLLISSDTSVSPPGMKLTAQLSLAGTIGPFTNPSLTLSWDKTDGFRIEDFPHIPIPNVVLDFAKVLKDAFKKKRCGDVTSFVFQHVVESHFFVKPTVSTTQPAGSNVGSGKVFVTIEGFYKVSALGQLVATVELPTLVLSLNFPSDFTFDGIATMIGNTIMDNAEDVLLQLVNDPVQLAKFLGVFLAQEALQTLAGELLCNALKAILDEFVQGFLDALVAGAADAVGEALAAALAALAVMQLAQSPGDQAAPPLPAPAVSSLVFKNGAVIAAWGSIANAAGYIGDLVDSKSQPASPLQSLAATAQSATFPLNVETLAEGSYTAGVSALGNLARPEGNSTQGTASILKLARPLNVTMTCDGTGDTLSAQWSAVAFATQYNVTINYGQTNTVAATAVIDAPATSAQFVADRFLVRAAGAYSASVQALAGQDAIASATGSATTTIPMLAAPALVGQSALADRLRVNWSPVAGATGYRIIVNELNGPTEALRTSVSLANAGTGGTLGYDLLFSVFTARGAGQYQAFVNAAGDGNHLSGPATAASSAGRLFAGIGFDQVGSTFTVS